MKNQVFLAHPSLLGVPLQSIFQIAKRIGFDGVEVLLTNSVIKKPNYYINLAKEIGLELTFHQSWEGTYSVFNRILWIAGILPKGFEKVSDLLPARFQYPVVIQSWRINELIDNNHYIVQPIFSTNEFENLSVEKIAEICRNKGAQIVFDVLYYLEYIFKGLDNIPTDKETIILALHKGWNSLKDITAEIHLYDFLPNKGLLGKNLLPKTGILPLREFLIFVKDSKWNGQIILELSPIQLFAQFWKLNFNLYQALQFVQKT